MEARINTIEAILKTAVLIDESETSNERVHLTSVVKIEMLSTGRQVQYKIVGSGSNEANPKEGKISDVEVETPGGIVGIKILEITK